MRVTIAFCRGTGNVVSDKPEQEIWGAQVSFRTATSDNQPGTIVDFEVTLRVELSEEAREFFPQSASFKPSLAA